LKIAVITKTQQELGSVALHHYCRFFAANFAWFVCCCSVSRLALKDFFEIHSRSINCETHRGLPGFVRRVSIYQCAKAHRRIQNIQLRLLKSFTNKQQSQNMEKLPYIVSLSLYFAIS
jgi:hypothetical protein